MTRQNNHNPPRWFNSPGLGFIQRDQGGDIYVHFRMIPEPEAQPLPRLPRSLQKEIFQKSEIIAAQRYSSGINSMFWRLSKVAAQKLSPQQIDSLPEDEKLVVRTASTFIK